MDNKYLLSDNVEVLGKALTKAIEDNAGAEFRNKAREGVRYYGYDHDILQNRIFYIDDNNILKEDRHASNIRIPHAFFTELVDQKVQYLLSNPVEIKSEDTELTEYLKEYYNSNMQLFLQEMVEGFSKKGFEYAYARTTSKDILEFQIADSLKTFSIYDENNNQVRIVRHYNKQVYKDGREITVMNVEVWGDNDVMYFITDKHNRLEFDRNREINPRPHVLAKASDGTILKRSYGKLPFFKVSNNRGERTDLEPIKALIDDYDLMAAYLSNNLQDFAEAIYVVKGFKGDNLASLRQNIKSKKTIGVGDTGGVDIKTVEIPVNARVTKLDIDKTAIYKFGMGFDSTQVADASGSVTNVAIQSGYSLLNMKTNKAEVRLLTLIEWMNEMIIEDINRRYNKSYSLTDISEIVIEKDNVVNMKEIAEITLIEEQARLTVIQSILAVAPRLDDLSVLELVCEQFDLDYEEIVELISQQSYLPGLQDDTDPEGVDVIEAVDIDVE